MTLPMTWIDTVSSQKLRYGSSIADSDKWNFKFQQEGKTPEMPRKLQITLSNI